MCIHAVVRIFSGHCIASEDFDEPARICGQILAVVGQTCNFVGNAVPRFIYSSLVVSYSVADVCRCCVSFLCRLDTVCCCKLMGCVW